tara:strand:+ start:3183 stop:4094 length:912 start_codon:yes stop_codon:yes gene_type:complete
MANETLVELQLDVLNQFIEYKGVTKVIPETYWRDTLLPFLYPLWDSDKDKMILYHYNANGSYLIKRRKYVKDFDTDSFKWLDYEMETVDATALAALQDKLKEAFFNIDSVEDAEYQDELARMYGKQGTVSKETVRIARDFLLDETDWVFVEDSPISADDKELYKTYRTKLRDLTKSPEFAGSIADVKFPISPMMYQKVFLPDNPGVAYLASDLQWLKLGAHYLKAFRDKIAHYLVAKSFTEKSYFDRLLAEYQKVPSTPFTPAELTDAQKTDRTAFLNEIIAMAAKEMENKTIGLYKEVPPAE